FCLFVSTTCYSQRFEYQQIPSSMVEMKSRSQNLSTQNRREFVDATKFLPKEYVTDGTVDYTVNLQEAINQSRKILIPNFPVLISDKSLVIPSNTTVFFQP